MCGEVTICSCPVPDFLQPVTLPDEIDTLRETAEGTSYQDRSISLSPLSSSRTNDLPVSIATSLHQSLLFTLPTNDLPVNITLCPLKHGSRSASGADASIHRHTTHTRKHRHRHTQRHTQNTFYYRIWSCPGFHGCGSSRSRNAGPSQPRPFSSRRRTCLVAPDIDSLTFTSFSFDFIKSRFWKCTKNLSVIAS